MIDLKHSDKKRVFEELAQDLQEKHHAEIPFSLTQKEFDTAATHFFDFLALPQKTKNEFYVRPTDDPRDTGIGYVRKLQAKGERDNKEYFHYHPSVEKRHFKKLLRKNDPVIDAFFDSARTIFKEAENILHEIVTVFETEHPHFREKIFPLSERWGSALRFLKYDVAGKGNFLAAGHYDMGACTLALAESAPGLRLGRDNETLRPVFRNGNTVFFMMGLNFPPITNDQFAPTWHDVVQESEDTFNAETARWAIVFFVGAVGLPFPSFSATGTPLSVGVK